MWIHFHCSLWKAYSIQVLYTDQIQLISLAVKSYQHGLESSLLYLTNTLQHKQRFFCFLPLWEKQIICKKKKTTTTIKVIGNVPFQKISILPLQKGLEFPVGWGILEDQKFKEVYWSFTGISRGVEGVGGNPFHGGKANKWTNEQ